MKTVPSLTDLWQQYFIAQSNPGGVDTWVITYCMPDAKDVFVSLANPLGDVHEEIFVTNVTAKDTALFVRHYKQRFLEQLPLRFGFFRPEVDSVLTEYPDWQTFYDAWIADDPLLLQGNMPLLFDFPTAEDYRAMKLKDADYAGYRRLLVVLYQYRKRQFQKVFIRSVDDAQFDVIRKQVQLLYAASIERIISPEKPVAR